MEKLVYLLWKPPADSAERYAQQMRVSTIPAIQALGATRVTASLEDAEVAAGEGLRITSVGEGANAPKSGMISFWLEESQHRAGIEDALRQASDRIAGYLVVESRPLVVEPTGSEVRIPGFSTVTCISRRSDLADEEFRRIWHTEHRACAIETQSTFGYTRNEIVRALTPDAPSWAAVVEENFPIEALTDSNAFFDAPGDKDRANANAKRMFETCARFLDLSQVDRTACSEYRFA